MKQCVFVPTMTPVAEPVSMNSHCVKWHLPIFFFSSNPLQQKKRKLMFSKLTD